MNDSPSASQRPTLLHLPPDIVDFTIGDIAVEFASEMGLRLYDWQQWCLRHILARRTDGNWAARDSVLEVPRQNGKNSTLEALELYLVFLGGARLVVHSAHNQSTAEVHFSRLRSLIEENDDLLDAMPKTVNGGFHTANGKERIELANGARISFKTRTKSAGRGPSPDAIIFDEAMILDKRALGALTPSLSARRKAMLVFASSAPDVESSELWRLRNRAISGDGGRLFYAGWNSSPDVDPRDEANWYTCNPSLGLGSGNRPGKEIDAMRADLDTLDPTEFAREHLGIPEEPASAAGGPISAERWASLTDGQSITVSNERLALDVSPDRSWATIGIAGSRADGLEHVGIRHREPGYGWVVARAKQLTDGHGCRLTVVKGSPAEPFVADLEAAGVPVDVMSAADYALACQRFVDAVNAMEPPFRHRGNPDHAAAIAGAQIKPAGDGGFVFSRRSSSADLTPLTTAVVAWGAQVASMHSSSVFVSLDDF